MNKKKYPIEMEADHRGERWRVSGNQIMAGVHRREDCDNRCTLHNPSQHHMRDFRLGWNTGLHIFFRECSHGFFHLDPDDDRRDATIKGEDCQSIMVYCDSCCESTEDF